MNEPDQQELEARARRLLREHADALPEDIAARLAAARRTAVAEFAATGPSRWEAFYRFWFGSGLGLSALGATAMVAAAVGLFLLRQEQVPALPPGLVMADEAEITAAQEAELLSELEFLAWLEASDVDAG